MKTIKLMKSLNTYDNFVKLLWKSINFQKGSVLESYHDYMDNVEFDTYCLRMKNELILEVKEEELYRTTTEIYVINLRKLYEILVDLFDNEVNLHSSFDMPKYIYNNRKILRNNIDPDFDM